MDAAHVGCWAAMTPAMQEELQLKMAKTGGVSTVASPRKKYQSACMLRLLLAESKSRQTLRVLDNTSNTSDGGSLRTKGHRVLYVKRRTTPNTGYRDGSRMDGASRSDGKSRRASNVPLLPQYEIVQYKQERSRRTLEAILWWHTP